MNLDEIKGFKTILEFETRFNNNDSCRDFLEQLRWAGQIRCLFCNCTKVYRFSKGRRFRCSSCKTKFSVLKGTIFENTKLPLWKWFRAIYTAKTGTLNTTWLKDHLAVSHKTAWFMIQRIFNMSQFKLEDVPKYYGKTCEVDETYNGANKLKQSAPRREYLNHRDGGGYGHRWAVFGIYIRNTRIYGFFQPPYVKTETVKATLTTLLDRSCTVYSDSSKQYEWMKSYFVKTIQFNHNKGHYGNNKEEHSNSIEGLWEKFKTFIRGTYRHVTYKYGIRYFNEFALQYCIRNFFRDLMGLDKKPKIGEKFVYGFESMERPITLKELKIIGQENKKIIDEWRAEQQAQKQLKRQKKLRVKMRKKSAFKNQADTTEIKSN